MAKVTSLKQAAKQRRQQTAQGKTLCSRGFHKWEVLKDNPFDVKQGKLVTGSRCVRCGKSRNESR